MPFRKAHALVGKLVAECAARGTALNQLPFEQLKKRSRSFDAERSSFPFAAAGDRCALAEKYRNADQGVAREVDVMQAIVPARLWSADGIVCVTARLPA